MLKSALHGKVTEHMTDVHRGRVMQDSHLCQNTSRAPNAKVHPEVDIISIMSCVNTASCKHTCTTEVKLMYSNLWWVNSPKTSCQQCVCDVLLWARIGETDKL